MDQQVETGKTKDNKKALVAIIVCGLTLVLLAACSVVTMINNEELQKKDKEIADLKTQLENAEKTNSGPTNVLECDEELKWVLTGEEALGLLKERVKELKYDYDILSANVIGKKNDDTYWVIYMESSGSRANVFFTKKDGKWDFEIPGFSGWTDETLKGFKFDTKISPIQP